MTLKKKGEKNTENYVKRGKLAKTARGCYSNQKWYLETVRSSTKGMNEKVLTVSESRRFFSKFNLMVASTLTPASNSLWFQCFIFSSERSEELCLSKCWLQEIFECVIEGESGWQSIAKIALTPWRICRFLQFQRDMDYCMNWEKSFCPTVMIISLYILLENVNIILTRSGKFYNKYTKPMIIEIFLVGFEFLYLRIFSGIAQWGCIAVDNFKRLIKLIPMFAVT